MSSQWRPQRSPNRSLASNRSTTFSNASGAVSATNASTSSPDGGSPVRSRYTRRTSVRLSASPTGLSPFLSSSARRNESMGDLTQAAFFAAGGAAFFGLTNDQNSRPFTRSISYFLGAAAALPSRGSGAPILTHASKSAMTLSASLPLG